MKKLFLLLVLILFIKGFGQTYTAKVEYDIPGNTSYRYTYSYDFGGQSGPGVSGGGIQYEVFTNVIQLDVYTLKTRGVCGPSRADDICSEQTTETIQNLIINPRNLSWGCMCVSSEIIEFTPNNLTITNKKSNIVCSGDQLELEVSSPNVFPVEAYHWQYSLDNKLTWIDVPSSIGTNLKTNNTPLTAFSINDLLGSTSEQHLNEQIYFRLGYDDDRPFSNIIPITFSPCAPVIKNIAFQDPKCSGDPMTVNMTFDRNLYDKEELRYFQFKRVDLKIDPITNLPINLPPIPYPFISTDNPLNGIVKLFDEKTTNVFTYSLSISTGLEDGGKYNLEYQAFLDGNPKGALKSNEYFTYTEPSPFYFTAKATPAICNGANGAIEILAWGGSSPYKYKLDSEEEIPFKNSATIVESTISKQKVVIDAGSIPNPDPLILTNHSIKVTDNKGCIDKTTTP